MMKKSIIFGLFTILCFVGKAQLPAFQLGIKKDNKIFINGNDSMLLKEAIARVGKENVKMHGSGGYYVVGRDTFVFTSDLIKHYNQSVLIDAHHIDSLELANSALKAKMAILEVNSEKYRKTIEALLNDDTSDECEEKYLRTRDFYIKYVEYSFPLYTRLLELTTGAEKADIARKYQNARAGIQLYKAVSEPQK